MCACETPNINGQHGYKWQPDEEPTSHIIIPFEAKEDDVILSDDPGRCGHGVDSHAYHFRIVRRGVWLFIIATHFGGSTEVNMRRWPTVNAILAMNSNDRYWTLATIYHAVSGAVNESVQKAVQDERKFWRQAAADNRIKKRKVRNSDRIDVWVVNEDTNVPLARSL